MRLTLSVVFAWGLLRVYGWAWWASAVVGGVWLLMDLMTVVSMFALSGSFEPLYQWPEVSLTAAFIAQAAAVAVLLQLKTGVRPTITLSVMLLASVLLIVGLSTATSQIELSPAQNELSSAIYSSVAERAHTPAVKVSIGTVNGVKGVRVVIGDSALAEADSAAQVVRSREVALVVRSLLPTDSDLKFIGIGWSLDTGPGVMPRLIHRFLIDELQPSPSTEPR
jgi:hypothetical protein